jgi:hypothetical protein
MSKTELNLRPERAQHDSPGPLALGFGIANAPSALKGRDKALPISISAEEDKLKPTAGNSERRARRHKDRW